MSNYLEGEAGPDVVRLRRRGRGKSYSSIERVLLRPIAPRMALFGGAVDKNKAESKLT